MPRTPTHLLYAKTKIQGAWRASERIDCVTPEEQARVKIDNLLEQAGWGKSLTN